MARIRLLPGSTSVSRYLLSILVVVAITLTGAAITPVAAGGAETEAPHYRFDPLQKAPGSSVAVVSGINDAGKIVGTVSVSDGLSTTAAAWARRTATPTLLPTGGFSNTSAADINNAGQIVGEGTSAGTGTVALLWPSVTSAPTPLTAVGVQTSARGINDAGQIVGFAFMGDRNVALFWATPSAFPATLPDMEGSLTSEASGINNAGQIIGETIGPDDEFGGFRLLSVFWTRPSASPTELPRMGSAKLPGESARGINDLGEIVGRSNFSTLMRWANPNATPAEVFAPGTMSNSAAGISNRGEIVSTLADDPYVWTLVHTTDLYLHGSGRDLSLDSEAPVKQTAESRDSAALKFAGGNPWKPIATWTQPPVRATRTLISVGPMETWIGLRNSADHGARFDLRADLLKNGIRIQSNQTNCIGGATRNPRNAVGIGGSLIPTPEVIDGVRLSPTDALSLRMSARIGTDGAGRFCGGRANATGVRLYFDAVDRTTQIAIDFRSR